MPRDFSVVALVAAYNEADIVRQVVGDLIDQGVDVYFLDDGSTDCTVAEVEPFVGRGVLAIERRCGTAPGGPRPFEWGRILQRKAALARELDADWFIHHDADEFRESPWSDLRLKGAIQRVDALGYNAIDFESLDFQPTHDRFRPGDDVRASFPFYAKRAPYDGMQIRCWKKTADVDLASSGGHDAQFSNRRVFPLRFILRHYPIRGQAHGERKIFEERRGRFLEEERARGWHIQYDDVAADSTFVRDPSTLTCWDPDAVRFELLVRHRGVEAAEAAADRERRALDACRAELARVQNDLIARTTALAHRAAEIAGQAAEIEELHGRLTARAVDLEAYQVEIARLNRGLQQQVDDVRSWREVVDGLSGRLTAIERSLSWRWTAPARAAYRLFRGR
jgi:hypothetical protein